MYSVHIQTTEIVLNSVHIQATEIMVYSVYIQTTEIVLDSVHIQTTEIMVNSVHIQTADRFKTMTDSGHIHTSDCFNNMTFFNRTFSENFQIHYFTMSVSTIPMLDYFQNSFLFQMVSSLPHDNLKNKVRYLQTIFRLSVQTKIQF